MNWRRFTTSAGNGGIEIDIAHASGTDRPQLKSAVGKGASGTYTNQNQQDPERAPAGFKPH
jgi:hypothetical protein